QGFLLLEPFADLGEHVHLLFGPLHPGPPLLDEPEVLDVTVHASLLSRALTRPRSPSRPPGTARWYPLDRSATSAGRRGEPLLQGHEHRDGCRIDSPPD